MRVIVIAVILSATIAGVGHSQLPAQKGKEGKGERPKAPPAGKTAVPEPASAPATNLAPKGGGEKAAYAAVVDANYMIGVTGYPASDGLVVMSTVQKKDFDKAGKTRCPAGEVLVDFLGNGKMVKLRLESGDKITAINGFEVKTVEEVLVMVNSASDPHAIDITFIDWRSGNEYEGKIDAMKVKK